MANKATGFAELEELVEAWRNMATAWEHLASTWDQVLKPLQAARISCPPELIRAMQAQASALAKKLASSGGSFPIAGPFRPQAYAADEYTDEQIKEKIRSRLANSKSRRPVELADILGCSKELVEQILKSDTAMFEQVGDRGWWALRK